MSEIKMSDQSERPGCLSLIMRLLGKQPSQLSGALPYHLRDDFLSRAEMSFYHVLKSAVDTQAVICPKVRLGDIFYVSQRNNNFQYINRIAQKHVDFLLCDPTTMRPLLGVELDDSSHNQPKRRERDAFVDAVFEVAGLKLLHIPVRHSYDPQQLSALLAGNLQLQTIAKSGSPKAEAVSDAPLCPKCGIPMVVRKVSRGENAGKRFYGCANYPACRQMLPYNI
jgi:hypothetical protein